MTSTRSLSWSWLAACAACTPGAAAPEPRNAHHSSAFAETGPSAAAVDAQPLPAPSRTEHQPTSEHPPEPHPTVSALDLGDEPSPVWVLPGGSKSVPLVIGAHGAGGSPEWQCDWMATLTDVPIARLCLRGLPLSRGTDSFYYPEHLSLGRWLAASLEKVRSAHGARLSPPYVYVGYSQGATMGALAIQGKATPITGLLLVEGGLEGWTFERSREFRDAGGTRVYFACGTPSCNTKANKLLSTLEKAGLDAKLGYAEGAGHTPLGAVEGHVREGLRWLLEGWEGSQSQL